MDCRKSNVQQFIRRDAECHGLKSTAAVAQRAAETTRWFCEAPRRCAQRRRKHDCLVTKAQCARTPIPDAPLPPPSQGTRFKAGGVKPLSFAYFSLRQAKKSRCPPHRGNANKPKTKEKATAVGTQKIAAAKGKNLNLQRRRTAPFLQNRIAFIQQMLPKNRAQPLSIPRFKRLQHLIMIMNRAIP